MRRPLWLGAGMVIGAGGTLWAQLRFRRRLRRALAVLAPALVGDEARRGAFQVLGRVRNAMDSARVERRRRERELRRREMVRRAAPAHVSASAKLHAPGRRVQGTGAGRARGTP